MGIKNFYHGFKKKMEGAIQRDHEKDHDILIIELNGLFYSSCKKIFQFFELTSCLESRNRSNRVHLKLFDEITLRLSKIIKKYAPKKTILLVVDGIAGMMKNMEQRQRRYKNSLENKYSTFDLNNFSPGTKLLNHLTKYIDWYLRLKMSTDPFFSKMKIFFSNEKVPGEGEFKICQFLKKYSKEYSKILIYNCDSDLILLSLTMNYDITIVRNSVIYGEEFINIKKCKEIIVSIMQWDKTLKKELFVDLTVLFFLLGNDYSPSSPTIYKFELLFDEVIPLYKSQRKYLCSIDNKTQIVKLNHDNILGFFQVLGAHERKWLEQKLKEQNSYFPDPILTFFQTIETQKDYDAFKNLYYKKNFENVSIETIASYYFFNLENVLNMFFNQKMNWSIFYPFHYVPFLIDFKKPPKFDIKSIPDIYPMDCCFNLVSVLPPQSRNLLPIPLQNAYSDLKDYFPTFIEFDLTGKKKIWEGTVKLPFIQVEQFLKYFKMRKDLFSSRELKRNAIGKAFVYSFDISQRTDFISYYGNIEDCPITCTLIDF